MGNYASACDCNILNNITPRTKNNKTARVIYPEGEIMQYNDSVKAAEVMIECPNFFLVNSQSLNINRRFSPLLADEELESGNVYLLFPMRRISSVVTHADMAVVWMAANNVAKRIPGKSDGVNYMVEGEGDKGKMSLVTTVGEVDEFRTRLMVCRSRKPLLDTIVEETVFCR